MIYISFQALRLIANIRKVSVLEMYTLCFTMDFDSDEWENEVLVGGRCILCKNEIELEILRREKLICSLLF